MYMAAALVHLDPSQYTIVPHVAVVDEFIHTRPNKVKGEPDEEIPIDQEFLDDIIANARRREYETGDLCPLTIGKLPGVDHTVSKLDERQQPKVIGYARNWHHGKLGNTNRVAAFSDFWIKNECVEEAKGYGRRSPEIWVSRREIDPICFLGATTPQRDLGLLPLALARPADAEQPISRYLAGDLTMPDEKKSDDGKATTTNTPKWEDCMALLEKMAAGFADLNSKVDKLSGGTGGDGQNPSAAAPAGGAEGGEPGEDMDPAELDKLLAELEQGQAQGGNKAQGEEPLKESFTTAGGDNTYTPKQEPMKNSRETDERIAKLERDRDELTLQLARQDVREKLLKLQTNDGVMFENLEEEVKDILALPAAMRPAQLARIEKNYKRMPVGDKINPAILASQDAVGPGQTTEENKNEVVRLARADGLSYEAAFKKKFGRFPHEPAPKV